MEDGMRLDRLEIAGFMHFAEPAVLDLREIPPGSLVAIIGENGHGKTRLLDAGLGGVYGSFPSRDGVLADYATTRNAYIDVLYSFEGRGTYRSRINVDGQRRLSDAVLEHVQPDGHHAPLNDGKVSTHKQAIGTVFPPPRVVLASAFSAQNRKGSFVTLSRGEAKDLFGELIGLGHYAAMAATAKACHEAWETTRVRLQERRVVLVRETAGEVRAVLDERAHDLAVSISDAETQRVDLTSELAQAEAQRTAVLELAQAHLAALERQRALTERIGATRTELTQLAADQGAEHAFYTMSVSRAHGARDAEQRSIESATADSRWRFDARIKDLDTRIAGNETISRRADEIRTAAAEIERLTTHLSGLRETLTKEQDALELAKDQRAVREEGLKDLDRIEREVNTLRQQAGLLDRVKFGAECGGDEPCVLVTAAAQAKAQLTDDVLGQLQHRATLEEGRVLWQERVGAHSERIRGLREAIESAERQIASLQPTAKYVAELEATQARIEGYQQQKAQATADLETRLRQLDADRERAIQTCDLAVQHAEQQRTERLVSLATRERQVSAEFIDLDAQLRDVLARLPETEGAARTLVDLDGRTLPRLRTSLTEITATLSALAERVHELERARDRFRATVEERADVEARLRTAEDRTLVWQTLRRACDRDGLPTLEIAAAGPTVSNLTNDLLEACFGSRFTVDLVTQEARADGKGMKETFELKVFDNQYGGDPRNIADLSGGERVIVEEALRAALALYVNSRNEAPIRTCWRDETTGALDPENATRYVAMLRRLQQLGGFAHVLFITHNLDAAALADVVIDVTNGQPRRRAA
jgi:DNA repair protein SbcC/Rad50